MVQNDEISVMKRRSQSTLQLHGLHESMELLIEDNIKETPEERELRLRGYKILFDTTTEVLSCIQILRRIIREYSLDAIGRELQHLSLTVASFERVLYTFIKEEIILASKQYNEHPIDAKAFREKIALKNILPLIPTHERFSILSGGVASILRNAAKSLRETNVVLEELQRNVPKVRKDSKKSFIPIILGAAGMYLYQYVYKNPNFALLQYIPSRAVLLKSTIAIAIIFDYGKRLRYRWSNLRRIKIHHSRVLMALRLFLLCQYVLQRAKPVNSGASDQRLLIDTPMECDIDDDLKDATTLLVERVPLPSEYYNCETEPLGFRLFKLGASVVLASSAFVHSFFKNEKFLQIFGTPLMLLVMPYYIVRQGKTSRYTARLLIDNPNVDVIRRGWRMFGDSKLVKLLTRFQSPTLAVSDEYFLPATVNTDQQSEFETAKKLPIYASSQRLSESDIGVHIYSVRPLLSVKNGTWEGATTALTEKMIESGLPSSKPVLIYIHGGGFFGRFIAKDFRILTQWAATLGAVIVYVDYGLAPEIQYPRSLNQIATVYKWVMSGGLGFTPDCVTLFGESAGANLAAALCLICIRDCLPLPVGNVFMFPALNMHLSPSPSRFLHQSDPVMPRGILELALNSYYPFHGHRNQYKDNIYDPLVSPGLADDELLAQFPSTALVVGESDPLLDDSVDFYTRLSGLNVVTTLKIHVGLSHGFIVYADLVPSAQKALDETCELVQKYLISKKGSNTTILT